jgi:hypothetical protein
MFGDVLYEYLHKSRSCVINIVILLHLDTMCEDVYNKQHVKCEKVRREANSIKTADF